MKMLLFIVVLVCIFHLNNAFSLGAGRMGRLISKFQLDMAQTNVNMPALRCVIFIVTYMIDILYYPNSN